MPTHNHLQKEKHQSARLSLYLFAPLVMVDLKKIFQKAFQLFLKASAILQNISY
jgi:hypothetical protein